MGPTRDGHVLSRKNSWKKKKLNKICNQMLRSLMGLELECQMREKSFLTYASKLLMG